MQGFLHHPLGVAAQQLWLRLLVVADGHIQCINALPRQRNHTLRLHFCQRAHLHAHRLASGSRQVFLKACLQLADGGEHRLVQ
ncbi:hypothetical protein D3C79_924100 [compost metagenome]